MINPQYDHMLFAGGTALSPDGCNVAFWEWGRGENGRVALFSVYGVDRDVRQIAAVTIPIGLAPFVRWLDHARFEYGYVLRSGVPVVNITELGRARAETA